MTTKEIEQLLIKLSCSLIKIRGDEVTCACPLAPWTVHGGVDRHPSFGVKAGDHPVYNCFTCGNRGTLKGLIYRIRDLSNKPLRWDLISLINRGTTTSQFKEAPKPTFDYIDNSLMDDRLRGWAEEGAIVSPEHYLKMDQELDDFFWGNKEPLIHPLNIWGDPTGTSYLKPPYWLGSDTGHREDCDCRECIPSAYANEQKFVPLNKE